MATARLEPLLTVNVLTVNVRRETARTASVRAEIAQMGSVELAMGLVQDLRHARMETAE